VGVEVGVRREEGERASKQRSKQRCRSAGVQGRGAVAGSRSRLLWSGGLVGCRAKATKEERGLQVLEWVQWVSGERTAVVQFGAVWCSAAGALAEATGAGAAVRKYTR
jgi:hypothetical protein